MVVSNIDKGTKFLSRAKALLASKTNLFLNIIVKNYIFFSKYNS